MKRKLIIVSLIVFVPVFVFLMAMVISPSLRFNIFRIATELPAVAYRFTIQKNMMVHDFQSSAAGLERQLWFIEKMGTARSAMLRGLIGNTEMVIRIANTPNDYSALLPYLEALVAYQPNLFIARLWLGKALSYVDPGAAFAHLEMAAKLIPADDRTYHAAVNAALKLGDENAARDWCGRYKTAMFGGTRARIYRNVFAGTGLRKMALEIPGDDAGPMLVPNEGIVLGGMRTYDFDLPRRTSTDSFRLHLGLVPGIKVRIDEITLFGPSGQTTLSEKEIVVAPEHGYVFDRQTFITTAPNGEIVTLFRPGNAFENVDRVDIRLSFTRLGLATLPGCLGD